MSEMKRCTGPCGETKPMDAFARNRRRRDGRQVWCKACHTAHYAEKKAAGVCVFCSVPAVPGETLCEAHAADREGRRTARRAAGLCDRCPAPAVQGQARCEAHLTADAARRAAYIAANPEKARAADTASGRKAYAAAKAEKRCAWGRGRGCTEPVEGGLTLCGAHRAKAAEANARRSARQTAAMLADCADMDIYRCHLCELPILPDDEMHRDHLVPVAHGGVDRCEATGTTMLRPAHAYCNIRRQDEHILVAVSLLNPGVAF